MDEDIETLVVQVRGDTQGFAKDIADMRAQAEGPLAAGFESAGRRMETALLGALKRGSFGFEDLRRVALAVMNDITAAAVQSGLNSLGLGSVQSGGGLGGGVGDFGILFNLLGSLFGSPGRATGGPVSPGRPFMVGERGPELFVPASAGRVETGMPGRGGDIHMTINVQAGGHAAPQALQQSGRQIARAIRRAVSE